MANGIVLTAECNILNERAIAVEVIEELCHSHCVCVCELWEMWVVEHNYVTEV